MGKEIQVEVLDAEDYAEWNRLVATAPAGSIYSTPEYLDALCTAVGGSYRIVAARRGGRLAGGVGLYIRDAPYGASVTPRLLLYYNGIVLAAYEGTYPSRQASLETHVLEALGAYLDGAGFGSVNLRCRQPLRDVRALQARGWSVAPSYSYVVGLVDMQVAWSKVDQNLRRLVDRCAEAGMEATTDDDFDGFFRLHLDTLVRKRAGRYLPLDAFRRYFEILRRQELCELVHVRFSDGRLAASQLVLLGDHPVTHTVAAATAPEQMKTGVSAFLRWKAFERLAERGYAGNDLTDAELNPVTRFKCQLGGHLDLNLVLDNPPTRLFRIGSGLVDGYGRARGMLGAVARRALRRPAR